MNVYQKTRRQSLFIKREGFEIQYSGLDESTGEKRLCNGMATENVIFETKDNELIR